MIVTLVLLGGTLLPSAPAFAQACEELWYQRNRIFKDAGYCFRTPRGVRTFGNAGCTYDDEAEVPLSGSERVTVRELLRAERAMGCPR